ncbi:MAG TPA: dynamin family protein, partial [Spirochaetia bacterium]|nr:dynamin family protein [Spirochaetia bacterium]
MAPDSNPLQAYTRARHAIADVLQELQANLSIEPSDPRDAERCRSLLAKLAEDRFNLVVVGQFSRGKSTLMNALFGRPVLPTGVLPLTSIITSVRYGHRETLLLRRQDSMFLTEVPIERMADWVTQQGNPGNRKRLSEAIVELPLPFLRRGFYFIDTPGIGSAETANTATTLEFLPQVDAVIFVTSVDSPMTETEVGLLRQTARFTDEVFLVLNKLDLLREGDARDASTVAGFVQEHARRVLGSTPRIYLVSALKALEAAAAGDEDALSRSGLARLRADIERLLSEKREAVFLASMTTKTLEVITDLESRASLFARSARMG